MGADMSGSYELRVQKGKYIFSLKTNIGQVMFTSREFATKAEALQAIEACRSNAASETQFELKKLPTQALFFVLKSGDGQVLGTSELYGTNDWRAKGIAMVKSIGPAATLDDKA
jgi:uncharacterized protein